MLAIIGGSGLTRLSTLAVAHREVVRTPYGDPSSALLFGQIGGRDAVFLARHGHGHTIPPHRVNYRANLWALQEQGRDRRRGGRLGRRHPRLPPGRARAAAPAHRLHVRPRRDVLRRRRPQRRAHRLHASVHARAARALPRGGRARRDSRDRRRRLRRASTARASKRPPRSTGSTATAPRSSGMTGMPEAALARELGLPYCAICVVVNHAAGRGDSAHAGVDGRHRAGARVGHGARARAARPRRAARSRRAGPGRAMIRDILRMGDPRLLAAVARRRALRHARAGGRSWPTCATRCTRATARGSPRRRSACRCAS